MRVIGLFDAHAGLWPTDPSPGYVPLERTTEVARAARLSGISSTIGLHTPDHRMDAERANAWESLRRVMERARLAGLTFSPFLLDALTLRGGGYGAEGQRLAYAEWCEEIAHAASDVRAPLEAALLDDYANGQNVGVFSRDKLAEIVTGVWRWCSATPVCPIIYWYMVVEDWRRLQVDLNQPGVRPLFVFRGESSFPTGAYKVNLKAIDRFPYEWRFVSRVFENPAVAVSATANGDPLGPSMSALTKLLRMAGDVSDLVYLYKAYTRVGDGEVTPGGIINYKTVAPTTVKAEWAHRTRQMAGIRAALPA